MQNVAPEVKEQYVPHAVDSNFFKPLPEEEVAAFRATFDEQHGTEGKFLFFWNNRNARRKQSGSLIYWFKDFLDQVGHDKAALIMHTNPKDGYGQDLHAIIKDTGLDKRQVLFQLKVNMDRLAMLYNCRLL